MERGLEGMSVSRKEELSLAKERSLRKLLEAEGKPIEAILKVIYLEAGKNSKTIEEAWQKVPSLSKSKSFISIERALAIFNEHSAETERFLGDLQKALEQKAKTTQYIVELYKAFKEEFRKGAMGHQDAYTNAIALRKDLEDTHWISTWDVWELFSGFQGSFFKKEPSVRKEKKK